MEAYKADEGMVWKLRDSEDMYGSVLYLGTGDTIERYEQVPKETAKTEERRRSERRDIRSR